MESRKRRLISRREPAGLAKGRRLSRTELGVYRSYSSLAFPIARFLRDVFGRVGSGTLNRQLIFIGRDSTILFQAAKAAGPKHVKLFLANLNSDLVDPANQREVVSYLRFLGANLNRPVSIIDVGKHGTVCRELAEMLRKTNPKTKPNAFLYVGTEGLGIPAHMTIESVPESGASDPMLRIIEATPKAIKRPERFIMVRNGVFRPEARPESRRSIALARVAEKAVIDSMRRNKL